MWTAGSGRRGSPVDDEGRTSTPKPRLSSSQRSSFNKSKPALSSSRRSSFSGLPQVKPGISSSQRSSFQVLAQALFPRASLIDLRTPESKSQGSPFAVPPLLASDSFRSQKSQKSHRSSRGEEHLPTYLPPLVTDTDRTDPAGWHWEYNEKRQIILTVVNARHLPKMDFWGQCDPYVVVDFGQSEAGRTEIKKGYDPDFGETIKLGWCREGDPRELVLRCMEHDVHSADDLIGQVRLNHAEILLGEWVQSWEDDIEHEMILPLRDKDGLLVQGQDKQQSVITITVKLERDIASSFELDNSEWEANERRRINVHVVSGRHMPRMDVMGSCDPMCCLDFMGLEHKTKACKLSYDPDWDEKVELSWVNSAAEAAGKELCVRVVDVDRNIFANHQLIGQVIVDAGNALIECGEARKVIVNLFDASGKPVVGNDGHLTEVVLHMSVEKDWQGVRASRKDVVLDSWLDNADASDSESVSMSQRHSLGSLTSSFRGLLSPRPQTPPTPRTPSVVDTPRSVNSNPSTETISHKHLESTKDPMAFMFPPPSTTGSFRSDLGMSFLEAETPMSPGTPSAASTPRFMWAGEQLSLAVRAAFYRFEGPKKDEIQVLLDLLVDAGTDRDAKDMEGLLQLDEFWNRLATFEGNLLEEEDLDSMDVEIAHMLREIDKELKEEHKFMSNVLAREEKIKALWDIDEDEYIFSEEVAQGTPREFKLTGLLPEMRREEIIRRFLKYQFYRMRYVTHAQIHGTEPLTRPGTMDSQPPVRKLTNDDWKRHRHALKASVVPPSIQRPERALVAAKVHFAGPVVRKEVHVAPKAEAPQEESLSPIAGVRPQATEGRTKSGHDRKRVAVPLPDYRPKPPNIPTKMDLVAASWANPGGSWQLIANKKRAMFREKYRSKNITHGLPPCPPPPGALRALPLPGEKLPGHKLRLKNLPMICSREDVLNYLGKYAEEVMEWDRDGFKGGIKMLNSEGGWFSGQVIVKFKSKRAAMHALAAADRKRMGTRLISACYELVDCPADRGRIKLQGVPSKTCTQDLQAYFAGWLLAPQADGHEPELLMDDEGAPSGEAVIIFLDVEAADHVLANFNMDTPIHGKEITFQPLPPIEYDEVTETWFAKEEIAQSTISLMRDLGWI